MNLRAPVPIRDYARRMPEHGRIRLGVKTGRAMKSIDTFRFTSPDFHAVQQLATQFGGEVKAWHDDLASPRDQWEVISQAHTIPVFIPPNGLSLSYELWTKAGLARRCDGVTMQVPYGQRMIDKVCECDANQAMSCKPTTRLNVVIPTITFGGVWRLETKGWNAFSELSAMEQALITLLDKGMLVKASLNLEQRQKKMSGETKLFVVPVLRMDVSAEQLLAGVTGLEQPTLEGGTRLALPVTVPDDADVVEAEIEEDDVNPQEWAERIEARFPPNEVRINILTAVAKVRTLYPGVLHGQADENMADLITMLRTKGAVLTFSDLRDEHLDQITSTIANLLAGTWLLVETDQGWRIVASS